MTPEHSVCPICERPDVTIRREHGGSTMYDADCPRCGDFLISDTAIVARDSSQLLRDNAPKISGLIRLVTDTGVERTKILTTNILDLASNLLIPSNDDIDKKSEYLLRAIRRRTKKYGDIVSMDSGDLARYASWAFAEDGNELLALLKMLEELGYIALTDYKTNFIAKITAQGWKHLKTHDGGKSRKGFVAIKFDGTDDEIESICCAIEDAGFEPICIKSEYFTEIIIDKALGEIRESGFVVVDITGDSSNVLFEAGFAYGLSKKVIFVCNNNMRDDAKFYSKHFKIYFYNSVVDLKAQLTQAIKAIMN